MDLNIVIPMAGRGSRFTSAGYTTPKPLIPVHGVPMVKAVVHNITPKRDSDGKPIRCHHIFLVLQEHIEKYGIDIQLQRLVPGSSVVPVSTVTEGAACTVLLAKSHINNETPLMIANSDQFVDVDIDQYVASLAQKNLDGLIMTFWSDHPKWSYCRFDQNGFVSEVVEKQVVSNEATVGIYNFKAGRDFVSAAEEMIAQGKRVNGEFYVAPAYNELIARNSRIGVFNIGKEGEQMHGLGVPEDLQLFLRQHRYTDTIKGWL